jgi:hypothetical protein
MNIPIATTEEFEDYLISKGKCPNCEQPLEQIVEEDTGYVLSNYCENCNYEQKY